MNTDHQDGYALGLRLARVIVTERLRQCRVELDCCKRRLKAATSMEALGTSYRIRELENLLKRFNTLMETEDDK